MGNAAEAWFIEKDDIGQHSHGDAGWSAAEAGGGDCHALGWEGEKAEAMSDIVEQARDYAASMRESGLGLSSAAAALLDKLAAEIERLRAGGKARGKRKR